MCQREKKITVLRLSSDILKSQPAEDRESFMKTDQLSSRDDRQRRQPDPHRQTDGEMRAKVFKETETDTEGEDIAGGKSIQRTGERTVFTESGRAYAVALI